MANAYIELNESEVRNDANIFTSYVVYKIKTDETEKRNLKARIVLHDNQNEEKDNVRKDSSNAQLSVLRLLLSLVTFLGFTVKTADVDKTKHEYVDSFE